jgi:hypothetical protein
MTAGVRPKHCTHKQSFKFQSISVAICYHITNLAWKQGRKKESATLKHCETLLLAFMWKEGTEFIVIQLLCAGFFLDLAK